MGAGGPPPGTILSTSAWFTAWPLGWTEPSASGQAWPATASWEPLLNTGQGSGFKCPPGLGFCPEYITGRSVATDCLPALQFLGMGSLPRQPEWAAPEGLQASSAGSCPTPQSFTPRLRAVPQAPDVPGGQGQGSLRKIPEPSGSCTCSPGPGRRSP